MFSERRELLPIFAESRVREFEPLQMKVSIADSLSEHAKSRAQQDGFPGRVKSLIWRYGMGVLSVAVALVLTLLLRHLFPYPFLFVFFAA